MTPIFYILAGMIGGISLAFLAWVIWVIRVNLK
jgi:hypothetical protein